MPPGRIVEFHIMYDEAIVGEKQEVRAKGERDPTPWGHPNH